eukprot:7390951-Karenia_brevis.AAC.1
MFFGIKSNTTSPVSHDNSMAKSSLSSAALEPNKNEGGLSHPCCPLSLSERAERGGVLAPSGGVSPPPSPSPFLDLGG